MAKQQPRTITSAVRRILRKNQMYTNGFENCYTVKCYGTITEDQRQQIIDLGFSQGVDITVKTMVGLNFSSRLVTIVRVPVTKKTNVFKAA